MDSAGYLFKTLSKLPAIYRDRGAILELRNPKKGLLWEEKPEKIQWNLKNVSEPIKFGLLFAKEKDTD